MLGARSAPLLLGAACACPSGELEDPCLKAATLETGEAGVRFHSEGCASLDLEARVLGEGAMRLDFEPVGEGLRPVLIAEGGPATFRGLVLDGELHLAGDAPPVLWRQGYQSWSWSGVVAATDPRLDADGLPEAGGDADTVSFLGEDPTSSWWGGLMGRRDGASLLAGAMEATKTKFHLSFSGEHLWISWGRRGESIALAEGEVLALDPLWLGSGSDPLALYATWADLVARRVGVRPLPAEAPVGWGTWYAFWGAVTEQDVRENLAILATLGRREGLRAPGVVQIDDGWARRWGDWSANERFPSGMAALAAAIRAEGMEAGIWLAPFYVSRETEVWAAHPDWWVRDEAWEELAFSNLGAGDYAIVDVTVPEAADWMARQVSDRVAEGYGYLKLDFLYAGAQEGRRRLPVTGTEAYLLGLEILREAAGDAWILACGAPLLPTVGFVESYRTGTDITSSLNPDPEIGTLRWQARASGARAWANGRWWWNDPDAILVGEALDPPLLHAALASWALAEGAWILGDDLRALPEGRLKLALRPELALRGLVPHDPLAFVSGWDLGPLAESLNPDDAVPSTWVSPDATLLLNLTDHDLALRGLGGTEVFGGASISPGATETLGPGEARIWLR